MLNNPIGRFFYCLLPYYLTWKLLSREEKNIVMDACYLHNNRTYADAQDYDKDHCRTVPPQETREGKIIQYILNKYSPCNVLEIGPGSGFYIPMILNHLSIKKYTAIDIVDPFLKYIENNLTLGSENAKVNLICGDFMNYQFDKKFDLIIFISSLHHMPNRVDIIKKCASGLTDRGKVVLLEPRYGIPRFLGLIKKYVKYYCKKNYWKNKENFAVHHYLTLSEISYLAKKSNLKISELLFYLFRGEKYLNHFNKSKIGLFCCYHFIPLSLFSRYVYVMLEKDGPIKPCRTKSLNGA
jgi:SAM-dependent methyltransferase